MALLLRPWVPLGCTIGGFEMCWGRRADFAEWDRGRCSFRSRENWGARRRRAGTVSKAMSSQWCQRRDFVVVNLVELTGVSSDRLELVEEMPVEFTGFDDDRRLLVPPRVLRISPGHLTPPSAPGTTTATSAGERASSKKPVVRRAPKQPTPKAARRLAVNAFQEIMAVRLEDQWKTLSARNAKKGSYRRRLFTDTMRQLPQSQKLHRHDRCCPRREQTWNPAAPKCSAFWRRRRRSNFRSTSTKMFGILEEASRSPTLVDEKMSSEDGAKTGCIACVQSCDISCSSFWIWSLQSSVPLSGAATSQLMIQLS